MTQDNKEEKPREIPTPEIDRMMVIAPVSQKIGEFFDWLTGEKGYTICKGRDNEAWGNYAYTPAPVNISQLLAEFFEIDMNKVENERRAILAKLSSLSGDSGG